MRPRSVSSLHPPAALTAAIQPRRVVEFVINRSRCTRALGIAVALACSIPAPASTIFLTGGALNGQPLSPTEWTISVAPGEPITGNVLAQVHTTGSGPSVVFPLGYTWTWGIRETAMVLLSSDAPFGISNWNVPINLSAPMTPGTHYILFGVRGEFTLTQVFSATNWTAGSGVWNDGNDYHDMDDADLLTAHENGGFPDWPVLFPGGFQPSDTAVMPIQVNVMLPGPAIIFVDDSAPPDGDGSSWDMAYRFLQDGLAAAAGAMPPVEVRVARGVYLPDRDEANPFGTGDRQATFQLIDGVALIGGFAGFGAVDPDARDIELFETILSGDLAGDDGPDFANNGENSLHVVTSIGVDDTAVLDGVTIVGGNADGALQSALHRRGPASGPQGGVLLVPALGGSAISGTNPVAGGGLINLDGSPTLLDCTFEANFAEALGGGMVTDGAGIPTLDGCTFFANRAGSDSPADGGGLRVGGGGGGVTVLNSHFLFNAANNTGGAIEIGEFGVGPLSVTIVNCTFTANQVTGPSIGASGGGAIVVFDDDPLIVNCTFNLNVAVNEPSRFAVGGAAAFSGEFRPILIDCVFAGNTADDLGGALRTQDASQLALFNCTLIGNSAELEGGAYSALGGGNPDFTNCLFAGNTAVFGGAISNPGDLTLINSTLTDNAAEGGGALYNSGLAAATVSNCIVYGNSPDEIVDVDKAFTTVTYSDVLGGFPGVGNIDADPLFVDSDGPDDDPATFDDNNYRIGSGSTCIDAADNLDVPPDEADLDLDGDTAEPVPVDLDGNPRFVDDPNTPDAGNGTPPIVDMGAYEFQGISFQPQIFPADGEPVIEAVGDLDGDGDTDVVIVIPDEDPLSDGSVQVFLNQGRDPVTGEWLGLEAILPTIPVGREPSGVAVGLFNNDSFLDVAVTNAGDNNVFVLLNNGNATFGSPIIIFVGSQPSAIVAGNFDGDADIDLAVTNAGDNNVQILTNDGMGGFSAGEVFATGLGPCAADPGDRDNDKKRDIAISNCGSNDVIFLFNDGLGDFGQSVNVPVGAVPVDLASGDLDGNTFADIVTANNGDGTVSIILNSGGGIFDRAISVEVGAFPRSVDAVDLDGDFDLDLAVVADDPVLGPAVLVLTNLATGGGGAAFGGSGVVFGEPIAFSVGADPNFVVSADFNGDGLSDLVTVNADADQVTGGSVTVLLNSPPAFSGLLVSLDIKPGECPNSFNRKSHGFLPVALVGTSDFHATMIDVASVLLSRVDGIGGSVAPNEGPPGPHSVLEDVATPFDGELCDCHELEGDGILDLSMKFRRQEIVEELQLSDLPGGAFVGLVVSGTLVDGTPFIASDCIRIVPAPDIDGDGAVGVADLLLLLGEWGPCTAAQECLADLDEDGYVSISDLLMLLANWG